MWASQNSDAAAMAEALVQYRDAGVLLSELSLEFLSEWRCACSPQQRRRTSVRGFLKLSAAPPLRGTPSLCVSRRCTRSRRCCGLIPQNVMDAAAPSCLVVATEAGQVLILSPSNFAVICKCQLAGCVAGRP